MRHFLVMRNRLVLCLLIMFSISCGGKVTTRTDLPEYKFTINGVVVKDMNLGKDIAYFKIWRNSDLFNGALVKVGSHTVPNEVNGTYVKEESLLFNFGQNISINISSTEDDFSLADSVVMPESFHINDLSSDDTLNRGGHVVTVTWSSASKASGYFLSVVTPDATPGAVGYTAVVKGQERTIPVEAFRTTQGSLVEGIYDIYLIAYFGGFPEYPPLPFELPEELPTGNLDGANGTIGAGVIAQRKHIRIVVE